MPVKSFFIFFFVFFTAIFSHADQRVNSNAYNFASVPLLKTDSKGNVYMGYYSKEGSLFLRKNNQEEITVTVEGGAGEFAELTFFDDDMVLTWRPKLFTAEKYIYVQRSSDGGKTFSKPIVLNTASHALPPIHVAADSKSRMYVAWVDERDKHRLYMNYSLDKGKTFQESDINLTPDFSAAVRPTLVLDGDNVHLFFLGARKGSKSTADSESGIYHRVSKDSGKTWSDIMMIQDFTDWTPFAVTSTKSDGNIMVFWAGVKGLYGAFSKDGNIWNKYEFKDAIDHDVSRLSVMPDNKGDVFIATSWKKWGTHYTIKPNVYLYRSEDNGKTWSEPQKLNRNEFDNTSAFLPVISVSKDGTIVVAWQDHRNIRGDIYINYSKDRGKTWLDKDINIEKDVGRDNSYYPYMANHNDRYYILWTRFADDRMFEDADLYMKEISIK